jgi:lipopolysaccharide export system protein LptA
MLRSTRGLLLLAIVLMLGAVAANYYNQKRILANQAPRAPKSLPVDTDASATSWIYRKDQTTHGIVEVRAKRFKQLNNPSRVEIEGVQLLVYKQDGKEYDDIRSASAILDDNKSTLYADGVVDITMGVPADNQPHGQLMEIHSSGVTYETKTGVASTGRAVNFEFEQGDGKAVGASYDPNREEIHLNSQVELHWRGRNPNAKPMKIETGELIYLERESHVFLKPWSRLTRDTAVLEGGEALVTLKDKAIDHVEAKQAHGTDQQPARELEYSANQLEMNLTPEGAVEKLSGEPDARLVSTTETSKTTITSRRVDMDFDTSSGASELKQALMTGNTVLESAPVPHENTLPAETRIVRGERVLLRMRNGGRDLDNVETLTPGRLEFLPNRPGQRHRTVDADHMLVTYGASNVIQFFRATDAATRTDPEPPQQAGESSDPLLTWSKDLKADFDPKTGQLAHMEQWNDFRYQEGDRRARANRATLEQARNLITLDQAARIWDASGATSADRILLDQKSGDISAEGNVVSTRMPDQKGKSSAMLTNDQPLEAKAKRMQTADRNEKIHYEGQAVAWQGANRVWADTIDIDRTERRLVARGHARTQFVEKHKSEPAKAADGAAAQPSTNEAAKAPTFVVVTAAAMVYTEADRLAHYTGGAHMVRPGMDVKASEIRAFLNDSQASSSLDHAFADGAVTIFRREADRTLTGTGEHAEYYDAEQRIFLAGGEPELVDSVRGTTKGRELTYYANDDKLLVNGIAREPARALVLRRHH